MKGQQRFLLGVCSCLLLAGTAQATTTTTELQLSCGGVGLEESEAMRAEVGKHALTILFTTPEGSYLSDVQTRIEDPLNAYKAEASCGPIGQVDVPKAGRYRVTATYGGRTQTQWHTLRPGGGARAALRWSE